MPKQVKPDVKKSVLIVEDSVDFSDLLKFFVEDLGLEGIQFPLKEEDIVGWVKKQKPSLILMDLALRKKGGLEYINDLRDDEETKDVPIVVISGRDLGYKELHELEMRGVKYLRKGRVEMEEIKSAIRNSTQPRASSTAADHP